MSDMMPVIAKTTVLPPAAEIAAKPEQNTQFKQNKGSDERAVILSVDTTNINKEKDPKKVQDKDKEPDLKEPLLKDVRTVSVSYDDKSGVPIVKFLDSRGNTVLQVPPEEYLRMKEKAAEEDSQKIPDIINKKV